MEQICAVIDAQGFIFKDRFVAREVAIVSDYMSQCQELNPKIEWKNLTDEEKDIVFVTTKYKHGLHFCPFNPREHCFLPDSLDIDSIIGIWYDMVVTSEKTLVAYKNKNIGDILKKLQIPCLDLDDPKYNFPTIKDLKMKYGSNYLCAYHKKPPPGSRLYLTCAYRKSNQIFREIKERILNDFNIEEKDI